MKENLHQYAKKMAEPNPILHMQIKPIAAGIDKIDRTWEQFVSLFPYYRLYYIRKGNAKIILRNHVLTLRAGYIYFIPAFSVIGAECDGILDHMWFHFQLDIAAANYLSVLKPVYEIPAMEADEALFCEMITSFHAPDRDTSPSAQLCTDGICRYLLAHFFLIAANTEHVNDGLKFLPILEYINDHLAEPIANKDLAASLYLSTTYFANLFTKQFGIPPRQYILNQRMRVAATKLLETQSSVKEIAFSLGFESESYFNRLFRKFAGVPPYKFRKLNHW